jgi:hypothetical protein
MHALIVDGVVVEYPIVNLRMRLPNVSLAVDLTDNSKLPEGFVWVTPDPEPDHNRATHRCVAETPQQNASGKWRQPWSVVALDPAEVAAKASAAVAIVRTERNHRLAECDWTQVADAPVDKTAWASYRQALRDVTNQAGFPHSVQWPNTPA